MFSERRCAVTMISPASVAWSGAAAGVAAGAGVAWAPDDSANAGVTKVKLLASASKEVVDAR
jgi:hypothetical protein